MIAPRLWPSVLLAVALFPGTTPPRLRTRIASHRISLPGTSAKTCPKLPQGPSGAEPDVLSEAGPPTYVDYAVSVTPDGSPVTWSAYTNGHTSTFTVTNTGLCGDTYTFAKSAWGPISGVSLNKTSFTLQPGTNTTVVATYNVGPPGTGVLTLTATGVNGLESDNGTFNVTVPLLNGPVISLAAHNGAYRDVSKCVAACFDAVASYATPPYFSLDVPRSIQLIYTSAQAKPMGLVQVDATDTTSVSPVKMSLLLRRPDGTFVNFTNGSQELFFVWAAGANRLVAQFDASTLASGAYAYVAVVRSYRADNSFRENLAPVRVLISNEQNSPFGAGWSIAGLQRLFFQSDSSIAITEGNGSVAYFGSAASCQSSCSYPSSASDFSTLTSRGSWPDNVKFDRRYPDGTTYSFFTDGRLAYVKDRFGNTITYSYNGANLLTAIVDPAGKADSLGYSGSNKLLWIKDPGGRLDSVTIDASSNLTRIRDYAGGLPFQGSYDGNHRLLGWSDRRGGAWGVSYDFSGKVASDTAPQVTASGQQLRPTRLYTSIEKGILVDPASGYGTSGNPAPHINTSALRATVTNPRGYTTAYALDRYGAPTRIEEPLGRTTAFQRDTSAHVTRDSLPSGQVIKYTWSGPNLTQRWDSATGRTINYLYEMTYNRDTLVYGDVDTVRNRWHGGHLDSTLVTGWGAWQTYTYSPSGRLLTRTDPGAHGAIYHYQATGFQNLDTVTSTAGGYTIGKVTRQYDGHGQPLTAVNEVGSTTTLVYDSTGRVFKTIGPLSDTTIQTFDSLYPIQVRDAKGQLYRSWVNALGWADSIADPGGHVDHYGYDANGNLTSWTTRLGQSIQFTYDSLDVARLVIVGNDTTKLYTDPAGRYAAVSNRESTDTLRFDVAGRPLVAITCRVLAAGNAAQCFRDSSSYQIRDRRTATVVAAPGIWGGSQFSILYHYNNRSVLDTLTNFAGEKATFASNPELMPAGTTLLGLNNLSIAFEYVWNHRSDEIQLSDSTLNAALRMGYYFGLSGSTDERYHGPAGSPDTSRSFEYDNAGELTSYIDTLHSWGQQTSGCNNNLRGDECSSHFDTPTLLRWVSYTYDRVGNRQDPVAPAGGLDVGNRLRRWQQYRMDYDVAGNLILKRTVSATDTTVVLRRDSLFWSALGRLDSVRTRDSVGALTKVAFGYDGLGRRVRKSSASGTSRFLWDGDALLMELDTLGNRVAEYTYNPAVDAPQSVVRHDLGDAIYYYLQGVEGNILALLQRNGTSVTIANQYREGPFGVERVANGTAPNALRHAGREYDSETQFYYFRARYYDPAVGRFISEDPLGLGAGINQYAYAGNDPVNRGDPSGLSGGCSSTPKLMASAASSASCSSGGGSSNMDIADAVDAWFWSNFGFGLSDALAMPGDDILFFINPYGYAQWEVKGGVAEFADDFQGTQFGRERKWVIPGLQKRCPLVAGRSLVEGRVNDGGDFVYVTGLVLLHRTSDRGKPYVLTGKGYYAGRISVYGTPYYLFKLFGIDIPGKPYGGPVTGTLDCVTGVAELQGFSVN